MIPSPRAFVIGHPIAHSRSPLIHGFWLRNLGLTGSYQKIEVTPSSLATFIATLDEQGFAGGNVTVPHKTAVMDLVEEVEEAARAIGAVNTLWHEDGRLKGGNTDALGFLGSLDASAPDWDRRQGRAIVLGAGGAARAVVYGLLQRGFTIEIVNRSLDKAEALAAGFGPCVRADDFSRFNALSGDADVIVNTTSLGMAGQPPLDVDLSGFKREALVCDIVYVPLETDLLRRARQAGHRTVDGLGMLLHQAVPGFERWFGVKPEVTAELRTLIEADILGAR